MIALHRLRRSLVDQSVRIRAGTTVAVCRTMKSSLARGCSFMLLAAAGCGAGAATAGSVDGATSNADSANQNDGASAPTDATSGDAAQASADGGIVGTGMDASAPSTPCPSTPPLDGGACVVGPYQGECDYLDCANYGEVSARCSTGQWHITSRSPCQADAAPPCSGAPGGGQSCASGQICQLNQSGAVWTTCVKNTCEAGLLSCSCLACNGCPLSQFTITCNYCPQGGCP
jgi:hypothetical protein